MLAFQCPAKQNMRCSKYHLVLLTSVVIFFNEYCKGFENYGVAGSRGFDEIDASKSVWEDAKGRAASSPEKMQEIKSKLFPLFAFNSRASNKPFHPGKVFSSSKEDPSLDCTPPRSSPSQGTAGS
jgi:hypothetical protein